MEKWLAEREQSMTQFMSIATPSRQQAGPLVREASPYGERGGASCFDISTPQVGGGIRRDMPAVQMTPGAAHTVDVPYRGDPYERPNFATRSGSPPPGFHGIGGPPRVSWQDQWMCPLPGTSAPSSRPPAPCCDPRAAGESPPRWWRQHCAASAAANSPIPHESVWAGPEDSATTPMRVNRRKDDLAFRMGGSEPEWPLSQRSKWRGDHPGFSLGGSNKDRSCCSLHLTEASAMAAECWDPTRSTPPQTPRPNGAAEGAVLDERLAAGGGA
jgi:hypothetical protein